MLTVRRPLCGPSSTSAITSSTQPRMPLLDFAYKRLEAVVHVNRQPEVDPPGCALIQTVDLQLGLASALWLSVSRAVPTSVYRGMC